MLWGAKLSHSRGMLWPPEAALGVTTMVCLIRRRYAGAPGSHTKFVVRAGVQHSAACMVVGGLMGAGWSRARDGERGEAGGEGGKRGGGGQEGGGPSLRGRRADERGGEPSMGIDGPSSFISSMPPNSEKSTKPSQLTSGSQIVSCPHPILSPAPPCRTPTRSRNPPSRR